MALDDDDDDDDDDDRSRLVLSVNLRLQEILVIGFDV